MPMTFNQAYCISKIEELIQEAYFQFDEADEAAMGRCLAAENSLTLLASVLETNPDMFKEMLLRFKKGNL